jgi:ferredoxin
MKAVVDADECTGCELCTQTCPEVFEMEDDIAVVKVDEVPADAEETCRQAVEECPVECISIEE